jgi:hypothetical protein
LQDCKQLAYLEQSRVVRRWQEEVQYTE